jgi:hypothetical protein
MWMVWILGCATGTIGGGDTGPGEWDGNTGEYMAETEQDELPAIDLEALGASMTEVLAGVIDLHAGGVLSAYVELMQGADASCPDWYETEGTPYWYDVCTSEDGTSFDGYAAIVPYEDYDDGAGNLYSGYQLWGLASILSPEGRRFRSGGSASLFAVQAADGTLVSYSAMEDGFEDSAALGTWLADSMDVGLTTWASWSPEYGAGAVYVDGVLSGLGGPVEVLVLEAVTVSEESIWGCELEPLATVSVLEGEGHWVDIVFDGESADSEGCDGCGRAFVNGREVGQLCTDFSTLLGWELSPWW